MGKSERRQLTMHPKILWDIIRRQAGSPGKAVLEGVMNSIDAGATRCDLELTTKKFKISDDGKGFVNDEEISLFFETFGHPHVEGDATYGRFRMGRGQIFAFGRNRWTTNEFRMNVDLQPQMNDSRQDYGLGYDFKKVEEKKPGCHIEVDLYKELSPFEFESMRREIADYVMFAQIPITLNGEVISKKPEDQKWDFETEDAYCKFKASGNLSVYNLGVLVRGYSSYEMGTGGIVVAKKKLDVNFARNDIQSDCKVFQRIKRFVKQQSGEKIAKKPSLNDAERESAVRSIISGEKSLENAYGLRLLTDVTGSQLPFSSLSRIGVNYCGTLTSAPKSDRLGETVHTRKMALVLADQTLDRFGVDSVADLIGKLKMIVARDMGERSSLQRDLDEIKVADIGEFGKFISRHHEPIADKELNKAELMAIKAIRAGGSSMYYEGIRIDRDRAVPVFRTGNHTPSGWDGRNIQVGVSDTADGWTNGTENIWVNRALLPLVKQGVKGSLKLAALLLHEYLHEEPSTGTHDHGVEFYERFHDLAIDHDILLNTAKVITETAVKLLEQDGRRGTKAMISLEDLEVRAKNIGLGETEDSSPLSIAPEAIKEPVSSVVPETSKEPKMAAREKPSLEKKKPKERCKTTAVKKASGQFDFFKGPGGTGL
ncbi:ATP-binding protein [Roseibium sp. RKSG952]|uniref:ATP-binding protein n=1 Tax=Roseibium sp. RKSG952 TaxID=2529384 RepID=UPI0018AD19E2|nr:ATP-binding protein [Roseibium sp. RKSG952]